MVKSSQDKEDGLPYAWGDNSHYRFGKQEKKQPKHTNVQGNLEDTMQRKSDQDKVLVPIKVHPFDVVFKKQRKDLDIYRWQAELTNNKKPAKNLEQNAQQETQTDGKL